MKLGPGRRLHLSLALSTLSLALAIAAFATNYWCVGTHRVVKPLCRSPGAGGAGARGGCLGPGTQTPPHDGSRGGPVEYGWETGEDRFTLHNFHTGFWLSCEEGGQRVKCRSFLHLTPKSEQGVLWFAIVAESLYIALLALGYALLCVEFVCSNRPLALKINSFAAVFTVLSGLLGMIGHMMYTTVFHVTVSLGPKDWKPQTWEYGWSFLLAWLSFSGCMASAVSNLNAYAETAARARCSGRSLCGTPPHPHPHPHLLVLDPERVSFLWESSVFPTEGPGGEGEEGEGREGGEGQLPTFAADSPC